MDELTSVEPSASEPTLPASEPTSQPSSTPQQQSAESSAPSERVNLFESQEFRNYQAQMTRQLQAAQQAAWEAQRRAEEAAMAQMDDYDKAEYRAQRAEAYAQQLQQEFERQQLEGLRLQRLNETAAKFKVPLDVLKDAETPQDMFERALAYKAQEAERSAEVRAKAIAERREANTVDLGGGSYTDGFEARLQRAAKSKDAGALYREMFNKTGY